MKKTGFTLIELLVALIIIAILAAIAIPIYSGAIERAAMYICAANVEAVGAAARIYIMKNGVVPATLASAWELYGKEALACVSEKYKKEKNNTYLVYRAYRKMQYVLARIENFGTANAAFIDSLADKKILKCPKYTGSKISSYGINTNSCTVGDCGESTFTNKGSLAYRHKKGMGGDQFAVFNTVYRKTFAIKSPGYDIEEIDVQTKSSNTIGVNEQGTATLMLNSTNPTDYMTYMNTTSSAGKP
jgi:prepilin-type N-terminal cleavage/methylation domain-containing protein